MSHRKGKKGLSNGIAIAYGSRGPHQIAKSQTIRLNKSSRQIAKEKKAQRDHLAGNVCFTTGSLADDDFCGLALSFSEREELLHSEGDDVDMVDLADWYDLEDDGLGTLPPGEEAFLQSHAGGEAVLHEILDGMTSRFDFPLN